MDFLIRVLLGGALILLGWKVFPELLELQRQALGRELTGTRLVMYTARVIGVVLVVVSGLVFAFR